MNEKCISVDDIKFPTSSGKPILFDGIFSGHELAGIELNLTAYGSKQEQTVEDLLGKDKVTVEDPFIDRTYEASTWMRSSSFQVGKNEKSYVIEVKEIDSIPSFDSVEIENIELKVINYEESLTSGRIGRHALLELSKEQFDKFRQLLLNPSVKFRRIGIDEDPLELRFGAKLYWSKHIEDERVYFKQDVWLFPLDLEPSKLNLASGITQAAMTHMLVSLVSRFELLVKQLADGQCISQEKEQALLSSGWKDLIPTEKITQIYDSFEQVEDAEYEF